MSFDRRSDGGPPVALIVAELPDPDWKGLKMTFIILSVVVIVLLIAVLAFFLFAIGVLLNRSADNLDDCLQNVKIIAEQAAVIVPGVGRINQTGEKLEGTLPLLYENAERIDANSAPPAATPRGLGYLDV